MEDMGMIMKTPFAQINIKKHIFHAGMTEKNMLTGHGKPHSKSKSNG